MKLLFLCAALVGMVGCTRDCKPVPGAVVTATGTVKSVRPNESEAYAPGILVTIPGQQPFGKKYRVTVEEIAAKPLGQEKH